MADLALFQYSVRRPGGFTYCNAVLPFYGEYGVGAGGVCAKGKHIVVYLALAPGELVRVAACQTRQSIH